MKFWRVSSGGVHLKDCLTKKKALHWAGGNRIVVAMDIETGYPHFDAEDLKEIRTNPIYQEQIGHLLPLLNAGRENKWRKRAEKTNGENK